MVTESRGEKMKRLLTVLVIAGMLIGAGGCFEDFISYNLHGVSKADAQNPRFINKSTGKLYHPKTIEIIKAADLITKYRTNKNTGVAIIGMTREQVIATKGEPNDKNYSVGSWGTHEQWVYGGYCSVTKTYAPTSYLYFENGILTSWQN